MSYMICHSQIVQSRSLLILLSTSSFIIIIQLIPLNYIPLVYLVFPIVVSDVCLYLLLVVFSLDRLQGSLGTKVALLGVVVVGFQDLSIGRGFYQDKRLAIILEQSIYQDNRLVSSQSLLSPSPFFKASNSLLVESVYLLYPSN